MLNRFSFLPVIVCIATLGIGSPTRAQDAPTADSIVAKVGDITITLGHMLALRDELPQHYREMPDDVLFNGILDQLIDQSVLMQSHTGNLSKRNQLSLENNRRATFASEIISEVLQTPVDDAALQAAYETKYARAGRAPEYKASHILVETKEQAQNLINKIETGAVFSDLAKQHSIGPSGANGGDLGWFGPNAMVEPFSKAVAALKPGQISAPVKTDFGWHVITLTATRIPDTPVLEDVRTVLIDEIRQKALEDRIAKERKMIPVDRTGAEALPPDIVNNTDILEY